MPSKTTKSLGFKCQRLFSPQISLNFKPFVLKPALLTAYLRRSISLFSSAVYYLVSPLTSHGILCYNYFGLGLTTSIPQRMSFRTGCLWLYVSLWCFFYISFTSQFWKVFLNLKTSKPLSHRSHHTSKRIRCAVLAQKDWIQKISPLG